jgi:hypothetical protein
MAKSREPPADGGAVDPSESVAVADDTLSVADFGGTRLPSRLRVTADVSAWRNTSPTMGESSTATGTSSWWRYARARG